MVMKIFEGFILGGMVGCVDELVGLADVLEFDD
jgi:hypothetical protein